MEFAGFFLEAGQLLLSILQLPGGPLQLLGQLLVGEFQLGILSLGFMLVIMQGCALAFQLERNGGQRRMVSKHHRQDGLPQPRLASLLGGQGPLLLIPFTALKLQ